MDIRLFQKELCRTVGGVIVNDEEAIDSKHAMVIENCGKAETFIPGHHEGSDFIVYGGHSLIVYSAKIMLSFHGLFPKDAGITFVLLLTARVKQAQLFNGHPIVVAVVEDMHRASRAWGRFRGKIEHRTPPVGKGFAAPYVENVRFRG